MAKQSTYEEIIAHNPKIAEYYFKSHHDFTDGCNIRTGEKLTKAWLGNVSKNVKSLLPKFGWAKDAVRMAGFNKAVMLIGAGPSFNRNKELLSQLCHYNAQWEFPYQPFLFMCSNHMLKPCVEIGLIPHFVMLSDASDVVYPQLCEDIPKRARGTILLAALRTHNKVLKEWTRQGRHLLFFLGDNKKILERYHKETGKDGKSYACLFGGNVLNQMYILATSYMNASVYMCVGNDLSYEYDKSLEKRRAGYYADGDYSSNLGTGRDEAKRFFPWMGYEISESIIVPGNFNIKFVPRSTTYQLFLYKIWMETRIGIQAKFPVKFHYYNCSEGGILGVMSRNDDRKEMWKDKDNWYMLDEIFPDRYHTRTLNAAVTEFLAARSALCQREIEGVIETGAGLVVH